MPPWIYPSQARIMTDFASLTGLAPEGPPERYLWTDAFAVCNFLGLYEKTGDVKWKELALSLVGQVHSTLGRYRKDDTRVGWISGLDEEEGQPPSHGRGIEDRQEAQGAQEHRASR